LPLEGIYDSRHRRWTYLFGSSQISVEPIEAGAGADAAVAKVLTEETRAAIASFPQFTVAQDAQLTALGRVSGTRGRRTITVQVVDKKGNAVQKLELPGSF